MLVSIAQLSFSVVLCQFLFDTFPLISGHKNLSDYLSSHIRTALWIINNRTRLDLSVTMTLMFSLHYVNLHIVTSGSKYPHSATLEDFRLLKVWPLAN